ncbi:MAG: DUF935 domain-containing protein [Rhodobiaceae bacterium]|nr:DUF935 domain-containing protein [Rhodobiaceae bacterium]
MTSSTQKIFLPDGTSYPIRKRELEDEVAAAQVTGVRSVWSDNITSGLTPVRLASILRDSARPGAETRDYLTLLEEIEERDAHYRAQLMTRKLAIRGLDPIVEATAEDGKPVQVADEIRDIVKSPHFRKALLDIADGIAKGYSVTEIIWNTKGRLWKPATFKWRDPRFFQYDRIAGAELRLRIDGDPDGAPLMPAKFIKFEPKLKSGIPIRGGIGRVVVWLYMLKAFTLQDWMQFLDVFGIPIRVGKYGPGASEADKRTLLRAVANLVADAAVTIPESMVLDILEAKATGTDAHQRAAEYWNEEISKVVVGQTMTADDGSSLAQAEVHDRVRLDILEADADEVAAAVQAGLVEPYCALNHGLMPEDCPQYTLPVPKPKDMAARMKVVREFVEMGGKVGMAAMRDEIGIEDPDDDEELLVPPRRSRSDQSQKPDGAPDDDEADDEDGGDEEGKDAKPARHAACPHCGGVHTHAAEDAPEAGDDVLAAMLKDWEPALDPLMKPVFEALQQSQSFEEFLARLGDMPQRPDLNPFADRLAVLTAIGRGIGDASR